MRHASTFVKVLALAAVLVLAIGTGVAFAEEPVLPPGLPPGLSPGLPPGLPKVAEPELPSGLQEPSLPSGLGNAGSIPATESEDETGLPWEVNGFWEVRLGFRIADDPDQDDASVAETRLQVEFEKEFNILTLRIAADFLYDGVPEDTEIDIQSGTGWLDLREINLLFHPAANLDIKAGRQVLTWGTGDLVFINDLFPKDWNSFFMGRDVEYLKAPSDAVKTSLFSSLINLDLVYTPKFDADRYIDGLRVSFFDPNQGIIVGRSDPLVADKRDELFDEDEIALRFYRNLGSYEAAFYGYNGFWKSPNGVNSSTGNFTFPRLSVMGTSLRGPVAGGIGHAELGHYDSRDDRNGDDPGVRNSEWRLLLGLERELVSELTGGIQYYIERMDDYEAYLSTLPSGAPVKDKNRHVITLRLTRMLMNQNVILSLFNFYSPSDKDGYMRVSSRYKVTDSWQAEMGGNFLYGKNSETFFGQFQDASNIYAGVRFNF